MISDDVARRYQLSDEKTFESLFHPQKDALLRLTDHFLHKTGCAPPTPCTEPCREAPQQLLQTLGWRPADAMGCAAGPAVRTCGVPSPHPTPDRRWCDGAGSLRFQDSSTSWACCCTARPAPARRHWSRFAVRLLSALLCRCKRPVRGGPSASAGIATPGRAAQFDLDAVAPHPQALAHYTDRNIISVPLSQIATNQQLQDIVFDQSFKVGLSIAASLCTVGAVSPEDGRLMHRQCDSRLRCVKQGVSVHPLR